MELLASLLLGLYLLYCIGLASGYMADEQERVKRACNMLQQDEEIRLAEVQRLKAEALMPKEDAEEEEFIEYDEEGKEINADTGLAYTDAEIEEREAMRAKKLLPPTDEEIAAEDAALARVAGGPSASGQRDDDDSDDEEEEPVDLHGDNRVD